MSSMLELRLTTRGLRSVPLRTPLRWWHCRWLAIVAEPPLPHEKTPASRVYASSRIAPARSSAAGSIEAAAAAASRAYAPKYSPALACGWAGKLAAGPLADGTSSSMSWTGLIRRGAPEVMGLLQHSYV